jgi:hypothetical protein
MDDKRPIARLADATIGEGVECACSEFRLVTHMCRMTWMAHGATQMRQVTQKCVGVSHSA